MKIGIGLPNQVRDVRGTIIPEWAASAERAGFSTLGTIGRVSYPGIILNPVTDDINEVSRLAEVVL
jgi:hypothetical protein